MNEVIVVGGNHHNALGVIRSFGKNGIKINLIVTNDTKYPFIVKSKYVKKYSIIKENEVEILDELSKYKNITPKPAIIPTSDYAEYVIDKNLDKLKKTFIVPSINNTQGEVIKYMDKFNQIDLCKKYKIDMAKSCVLVLNNELNLNIKLKYPYILKPIESINGKKTDIQIVSNPKESKIVSKEDINKLGLKTFFFSDASGAINRKIFNELNGYDEKRLPISEDMYFAYKILISIHQEFQVFQQLYLNVFLLYKLI